MHNARPHYHHHGLCTILTAYNIACLHARPIANKKRSSDVNAIESYEATSSAKTLVTNRNRKVAKDIGKVCIKS